MRVWSSLPDAGQVVLAKVDDTSGEVTEAWTGPQVAWKMARGYDGAFGRKINNPWIWLSLCLVFFLGLADLRRPLSIRNVDLLVLLSFGISLYFFNRGEVFTAMPLAYPPLLYLLGRMAWIGWKGRGSPSRALWPVWVLLAATVFLAGFRFGLNVRASNVIDVGLAGVIGAQRIAEDGESPYGNMPDRRGEGMRPGRRGRLRPRADPDERPLRGGQRPGRHVRADQLPGIRPGLPDHGLRLQVGRPAGGALHVPPLGRAGASRHGAARPAVRRAASGGDPGFCLGGVPVHPVRLELELERRDHARIPHLGPRLRDVTSGARALRRPGGVDEVRSVPALPAVGVVSERDDAGREPQLLFLGGFLLATALGFWILLLEPDPLHAARVFWDRTFGWQLGRSSPFSIWDWDEYPGYPDLHVVQTALKALLLLAAGVLAFVPRTRNVVQLAALSGRAPDRLRARPYALVLPLHPVVLPLRRVRAARARSASRRTGRRRRPRSPRGERPVGELVPAR